jgi:hypothetical protein
MTITLTPGDIIIHLIMIFGAAFLLSKLPRLLSVVGDYWASRRMSSRRRRAAWLEDRLSQYEADFSDIRVFIGRLVAMATFSIVTFCMGMWCIGISLLLLVKGDLLCNISHDCAPQSFWAWATDYSQALRSSSMLVLFGLVCLLSFFSVLNTLFLEVSPDRLRARMAARIARLRDGVPES